MDEPTTITLDTPITRGEQIIETIILRKPQVGALRGTSLAALVNLDVDALQRVLPRITTPTLTEAEIAQAWTLGRQAAAAYLKGEPVA